MAWPTYAVPTGDSAPGSASVIFQSAAAGAGLNLQSLPLIAQLQIVAANLLGQAGTVQMPGAVIFGPTSDQNPIQITGVSGADNRGIAWQTNGVNRWRLRPSGNTESGGNAGSDFTINAYSDDGTSLLGQWLFLRRSTGELILSAYGGGGGVVSVGAVDSGGAGFRLLRVPN